MERSKICEAMVFAIDNADSASEVGHLCTGINPLYAMNLACIVTKLHLLEEALEGTATCAFLCLRLNFWLCRRADQALGPSFSNLICKGGH